MKAATRSLALRLSGDPSVTDPSRLFYGNNGCHFELFNNGLAIEEVDELVQQSLHVRNQQTVNNDQNGLYLFDRDIQQISVVSSAAIDPAAE